MVIDQTVDRLISKKLVAKREARENGRTPSGKLSASILGWPLQWQMLKALGIPQTPPDEYTLRKFLRGEHVEEWLISHMPGVIDKQKLTNYRGVIGYIDTMIDTSEYELKVGIIPCEIKSVSNLKFKRIVNPKNGEADPQHKLQAELYALGEKSDYYALIYVSTDDYRVKMFVYKTGEMKAEIDEIISDYASVRPTNTVPVFTPRYDWQKNIKYNNYPEWMYLTADEISDKVRDYLF